MIYATFCTVTRNNEKYRLYCFADQTKQGLAKKIIEFLDPSFVNTLDYYSRVKGIRLTRNMSCLGTECQKAGMNVKTFTNLIAASDGYPMTHFTKDHFEGSMEFFNGKTSLWLSLDSFAEGLHEFLDHADLFLYSQGLWDSLPSDFMQYTDEEKAFQAVYDIISGYNNKQPD